MQIILIGLISGLVCSAVADYLDNQVARTGTGVAFDKYDLLPCPEGEAFIDYWHSERGFDERAQEMPASVVVPPCLMMLIKLAAGEHFAEVILDIRLQTGFVLDSRNRAGGAGAEYVYDTVGNSRIVRDTPDFIRDIDDIELSARTDGY